MTWTDAMIAWGPAYPLIAILLAAHCHAVYYVIPRGFRALEKAASGHEASAEKRARKAAKKVKQVRRDLAGRERKLIRKILRMLADGDSMPPAKKPKKAPAPSP